MDMENTQLMKPYMKDNGLRVKSQEKEKLFLKAEVFLKDLLQTIWNKDMERCTIIHQEIILKGNGKMIKNKEKEQWIGLI